MAIFFLIRFNLNIAKSPRKIRNIARLCRMKRATITSLTYKT